MRHEYAAEDTRSGEESQDQTENKKEVLLYKLTKAMNWGGEEGGYVFVNAEKNGKTCT